LPGWAPYATLQRAAKRRGGFDEVQMTVFVGSDLSFGDLILMEEFDYEGKLWRSYLLVPQEHLEDLFRSRDAVKPRYAYDREHAFWNRLSELTRDSYRDYLETQATPLNGGMRRQWFQWKDFDRLEAAFQAFKAHTNQPIRLSIVARESVH
jgi:hypothetical protein